VDCNYGLSPIKMIASENLVFVIKALYNDGEGNKKYCLYYEDGKI
jgi:hypothetical protein